MSSVVALLCGFVVLGLLKDRLYGFATAAMFLMIIVYVTYAYIHG